MNNQLTRLIFSAVFFITLMTGCAGGNILDPFAVASNAHVDYMWTDGKFDITGSGTIAVGVIDRREYILSGNKSGNFTGLARTGEGIPHDVTTLSNKSLANDMMVSIASGFNHAGLTAYPVILDTSDLEDAQSRLLSNDANSHLLLVINEWKADTYYKTKLTYDLDLIILSSDGKDILHKTFSGVSVGESGRLTPKGRQVEAMEKLYPEKLREIFENPEVKSSLIL